MLSMSEFCVGMHLIVCVSKKGLPCPATRPPSLLPSAGSAASGGTTPAQALGGSHVNPVPQSPIVTPSPPMQPPSSPPSAMLPLGAVASSSEDAFRWVVSSAVPHTSLNEPLYCRFVYLKPSRSLFVFLLEKAKVTMAKSLFIAIPPVLRTFPCSALAVDLPQKDPTSSLGSEAEAGTPAPEQGPPATEQALRATQLNTISRSPTSTTNVSEDPSSVGDSTSATAGMQELVGVSGALLVVARDASTAQNQVNLSAPVTVKDLDAS